MGFSGINLAGICKNDLKHVGLAFLDVNLDQQERKSEKGRRNLPQLGRFQNLKQLVVSIPDDQKYFRHKELATIFKSLTVWVWLRKLNSSTQWKEKDDQPLTFQGSFKNKYDILCQSRSGKPNHVDFCNPQPLPTQTLPHAHPTVS